LAERIVVKKGKKMYDIYQASRHSEQYQKPPKNSKKTLPGSLSYLASSIDQKRTK
jgi:hypothetical protein